MAEEKLYYLERYFYAFNQATKKAFDRRVYVDLLAGPGRCYRKDRPEKEFAGSPIRALTGDAAFTSVLCVEGDARNVEALTHRVEGCERASTASVHHGDANDPATISIVRTALSGPKTLGLIFVDTLGLSDVSFRTLKEITKDRRAGRTVHRSVGPLRLEDGVGSASPWAGWHGRCGRRAHHVL